MKTKIVVIILCTVFYGRAQNTLQTVSDSIKTEWLTEVVITSPNKFLKSTTKPLGTLDEYLQQSNTVSMVRRGVYASEPFLNGMSTDRSVITIDGMRIYGACTDKMDPVTSYVEISNLQNAHISSGQSGTSTGATVAGSLDLVRKKSDFGSKHIGGSAYTGFESNNKQRIFGGNLSYATSKFFADVDATYRKADNYKAGGGDEVLYSQFQKLNTSAIVGYKISDHKQLEASFIYDHASNIGYPALPMDVLYAKAFIGSIEYKQHHISNTFHEWQTKFYYNQVTHVMDDSKRPDVPIRMDMPGWTKTTGAFSTVTGSFGAHYFKINANAHHNYSLAEMTMFSNTPNQKDMFMLTWPGVSTNYGDMNAEDTYNLNKHSSVKANVGLGLHNNQLNNQFGFESLQIFYPDLKRSKTRLLKRMSVTFQYQPNHWLYSLTAGYGERAPSISEAYGFYLFNSFDRFDYIGDPNLKNEKSTSIIGQVSYNKNKWQIKATANLFHISNYIIGKPNESYSVMTIGAAGVKVYEQLPYATIYNTALDVNYRIFDDLQLKNKVQYTRGIASGSINLPTMQPCSYQSTLIYFKNDFTATFEVKGAAKQTKINTDFGEKPVASYTVLNASFSKNFYITENQLVLKLGIENILDKKYTTFADWNRLPQMGRNIFINTIINF